MASAAELNVVVKGDDKASGMLKKLGGNAQQMGAQFQKAGMAMVAMGGAMALALGKSVKDWAAAGDEVQKMSLRTNWAAESLSELRHVAEITGTELQAFEKGTRRMSAAIIDASDGMTEYLRDFEKLGLDAQKLKGMKPEEAFWEIAYALGNLENELEQASIAQGIFGRSGTQLLPMLSEGQAGIEALRLEAHELGIVFDQEAANAAASLTDSLHRVGEAINGVKFAMAEALAPSIEEAANKLQDLIVGIGNFVEKNPMMVQGVALLSLGLIGAGGLAIALGTVIRNMTILTGLLGGLSLGFTALAGAIGLAGGALMAFGGYLLYQNAQIDAYNAKVKEIFDTFNAEYAKFGEGMESDWLNAAKSVLAVYRNMLDAGQELNAEQSQYYWWLERIIKEEEERLRIQSKLQYMADVMNATLAEHAKIKGEEATAAAAVLEAEKILRDELNEKAREQVDIINQQTDAMISQWNLQDARLREKIAGEALPGGTLAAIGGLSTQGALDYWKVTLDMLRQGITSGAPPGLLDWSLGQPNMGAAIERAEHMVGFYSNEAGNGNPINVTLEIDGTVLATIMSDYMGAMVD